MDVSNRWRFQDRTHGLDNIWYLWQCSLLCHMLLDGSHGSFIEMRMVNGCCIHDMSVHWELVVAAHHPQSCFARNFRWQNWARHNHQDPRLPPRWGLFGRTLFCDLTSQQKIFDVHDHLMTAWYMLWNNFVPTWYITSNYLRLSFNASSQSYSVLVAAITGDCPPGSQDCWGDSSPASTPGCRILREQSRLPHHRLIYIYLLVCTSCRALHSSP